MHDKGLIHADFKESNVLQRGAEFRLIDFDRMLETHKCTASDKVINFSEQPDSFSAEDWNAICANVRVPALGMNFWDHGVWFHYPSIATITKLHRLRVCKWFHLEKAGPAVG